MAARAGVIFAGQVLAVTRNDAAGFVDIRFRIDLAVYGCASAGTYVLREWSGLWAQAQADRYIAGQFYLMLLTARGPSGMSAPVGGNDGAIRLIAAGEATSTNGPAIIADLAVDLRWVRANALRTAAPTWTDGSRDDLNQPLAGALSNGTGPVGPLARVSREPRLQTILPWLEAASRSHAAN